MKKLVATDLLDLTGYEKIREQFVQRTIELKRARRVGVGNELTFVFENRDTILFQVQEMLRAERTVKDEAIQYDLDVYNELMPGEHELSATLMIEITDPERIKPTLDRLAGIDEHVFLDVGGTPVAAAFDPRQYDEDRIAAVQYLRFPLGPELSARFRDESTPATLRVAHPAYGAQTPLTGPTRASLTSDLTAT